MGGLSVVGLGSSRGWRGGSDRRGRVGGKMAGPEERGG